MEKLHCDFMLPSSIVVMLSIMFFGNPSPAGGYKINVNGSFSKDKDVLGIRLVIRDHEGFSKLVYIYLFANKSQHLLQS